MSKPQSRGSPDTSSAHPKSAGGLAGAMEAAFKNNSKLSVGADAETAHDRDDREMELEIRPPEGYTMSSVYPPQPCERCVRTNKTCKGVAGSRCEHCKNLHQKCSNSTGPPRGRHAVAIFQAHASDSGFAPPRAKRKSASKPAAKQRSGDDEEDELDEDEDEEQRPKKRQTTQPGSSFGPRRSRLLKRATDIESAIKQLQTYTVKELSRLTQIASNLAEEIRELE